MSRYLEFIEFCKTHDQGAYTHKHHILPKSHGGTDDVSNIIELSWLAHYYAHQLLAKENPDDEKITEWLKEHPTIDGWIKWCYKAKFRPFFKPYKPRSDKGKPRRPYKTRSDKGKPRGPGKKWSDEARKAFSERQKARFQKETKRKLFT